MTLSIEVLVLYKCTVYLGKAIVQKTLENIYEKCYATSCFFARHHDAYI